MKLFAITGLGLLVATLCMTQVQAIDANIDPARFGDKPASTFDPARWGSDGSTGFGGIVNTPLVTGGGVQPTVVKTQTITRDNPVVKPTEPVTAETDKGLIGPVKPAEEPQKELTDKQKDQLEKAKAMCETADGKKLAGEMAADEEAIKLEMAEVNMKPDAGCLGASKAMYSACAKGDNAGVATAALKAAQVCQKEDFNKYKEAAPAGNDGIVTGAVDTMDPLEKIKETVEKTFNPSSLLGSTNMQSNPLQQMLMAMIAEKVMGAFGGGSGGSGDDGVNGTTTICVASVTAALQNPNGRYYGSLFCPAGTLPKAISNKTGEPVDEEDEPEVVKPTCDAVKDTATKTTTTTEMGADLKDVKVVTKVITDTCKNGNTRVKTVVTKTSSDGKEVETEQTTITAK